MIDKKVSDPYGESFVSVHYDESLDAGNVLLQIKTDVEILADIRLPKRQAVLLAHALLMCTCPDDEYERG